MTKFKIVRCQPNWHSDCNKVAFDYRYEAREYASYLFKNYGWGMRIYWDEDCECYHLTKDLYSRY